MTTDIIFTAEDYTHIDKLLSSITLDHNNITIVCTPIFFQRWIHYFQSEFNETELFNIDNQVYKNKIKIPMHYKNKFFIFNFIIFVHTSSEISHPLDGIQIISTGMNTVKEL